MCLIDKTSTFDDERKRNEPFTSRDICQQCYLGLEKKNIHIWGKQVHWEHANKMKLKQQKSRKLSTNHKVRKGSTFSSVRLPSGENFYPVPLPFFKAAIDFEMLTEEANRQ